MKAAEDSSSSSAADDAAAKEGGGASTNEEEVAPSEELPQSSADDVSNDDYEASAPPPESSASSKRQQHAVPEVPKFRFVAIAKKSAGYSSAAAGSYVKGKSAKELAVEYQEPDVAATDTSSKEPMVVGKLNIAERQAEMGLVRGGGGGGGGGVDDKKVGGEEKIEEAEEEKEEEEEPTIIQEEVEQSEEKDLEAAIPPVTEKNKMVNDVVIMEVSNDGVERQGVVVPTNKNKTDTDESGRRKLVLILVALLVILVVAAVVVGVALGTKPSSGDDTSGLRGEESQNNVDDGNATSVLPSTDGATVTSSTKGPSEIVASWDAPTSSPRSPTAFFNEPTQAPAPTAVQRCQVGSLSENACMAETEMSQRIFVPRGGGNLVNVNFGHSLAFINDNILAAATDGSVPGAGVHIFFKTISDVAYDHYQTIFGDQQNLINNKFGYSLATSKNTNSLVVGAPARNTTAKVDCVQQWCGLCSWSTTDSTLCEDRLDRIVESSNGDEDVIKQQIMTSGRCEGEEICTEIVSAGKVYVYEPTGSEWERVSIITSDDPSFGSVVAMDEGVIAIGSPDEDKVTVYEEEENGRSWTLLESKTSPTKGARFGASLSLSGGTLVVGAPLDGIGGVVYVYAKSARGFVPRGQPLAPRDIQRGDNFGEKVSVSGCTVAVSSSNAITASTTSTGSVRIFNYDPDLDLYSADQIVEPTEEVAGVFPDCVVMEGNNLLIGSSSGSSSGLLTHFVRRNYGSWTQKSVIRNPQAGAFGCGLSISESKALVGAKGTEQGSAGSFYVAELCAGDELI